MISNIIPKINKNYSRHITIVDDFLENPDEIREYALTLSYEERYSVGVRTKPAIFTSTYKSVFEEILNRKILNNFYTHNDDTSTNGCFQWCNKEVPPVIHCDETNGGGVLFLTPDAPKESGTAFYEHKETGLRKLAGQDEETIDYIFKDGFLDFSGFREIERVSNVYNRLILFDGRNLHSGVDYFGKTKHDSRLFQIFFFTSGKESISQTTQPYKPSLRVNPI